MFKSFDYSCQNDKCPNYKIKEERLVKDEDKDKQICKECGKEMNRGFGVGAIKTNDNQGRMN